ncbi:hypothetical protein BUE80_DR000928 [Diplocarpon rosae]|nr:hypothetical protein BUE80_DR000928 [Diplocarpon rosae]
MASPALAAKMSKPYPPTTAGLGLTPTKSLDGPITAIFLFLFLLGAAAHMTILQVNMRRGHKFIISGLLFGFCMARATACTMRLVWTSYIADVSVAIAAQIFVAAGVLLLFIINLIFTQRVMRASHPDWAWTKAFSLAFKFYYGSIVLMLIALIFCTVQSFYTLDTNIRRADRDVQLVGSTYFAVAAFLPLPLLALNFILPKPRSTPRVEKFGAGRFRTKILILLFSSFILTFAAAFRAGIAYVPRPRNNPAWYHSKACFYVFNFAIEVVVVALYAGIRVDKRFHVPNASHGPGDYLGRKQGGGKGVAVDQEGEKQGFLDRINTEERMFDGDIEANEGAGGGANDLEMGNMNLVTSQERVLRQSALPGTDELEKPKSVKTKEEKGVRLSHVSTLWPMSWEGTAPNISSPPEKGAPIAQRLRI